MIYAQSGPGPIVLLTSLDSDMNHILALEMGACDYILKTTPPAVLLARLRLHLRQNEQATVTKGIQETSLTPYKALHFGTLTIDPINRVVSWLTLKSRSRQLISNYCGN